MVPHPALGILFHWIGGLAAASFYIPYRKVRHWSWETYWLVGGLVSWVLMPWLMASLLVPDLGGILRGAPAATWVWTCGFGVLWGVGGLTFGLTMRYLGIALGMAVALGYTAVFGTLVPPLFHGTLGQTVGSASGRYVVLGVGASVLGIVVSGLAGMSKERELTAVQKQATVSDFRFGPGMLLATFSGIMSSCFAFGLDAGGPITAAARDRLQAHGISDIWSGLPVLIVILLGGFLTNVLWCLFLAARHRSGGEYFGRCASAPGTRSMQAKSMPLVNNYLFSAMAGILWYLQFFFYTMGQTRLGQDYAFSNWTLHMASIMIFSMLWGVALKEWAATSRRTHGLIALGLLLLIGSTVIIGYGNYLSALGMHAL